MNIGRHINGVIVRELIQFELTGDHPYGTYCSRSISYDSYDMNHMRWSDSNVLKLINTLGLILNLITMAHSLWAILIHFNTLFFSASCRSLGVKKWIWHHIDLNQESFLFGFRIFEQNILWNFSSMSHFIIIDFMK